MDPGEKFASTEQAMQAARAHVEAGRMAHAEAIYRRVLEAEPGHAEAHHNLGFVLERTGRLEAAEQSYRAALAFRPASAGARNNLGNLLRLLGRTEEAEQLLRAALSIEPRYFEALNNLGIVLQHLGRIPESVASFQSALALNPGSAEVHSNLGSALAYARRYAESESHCRRALALRPGYADASFNLGVVLQQAGRFQEAEQAYRAAIASAPHASGAHQNLAALLLGRGEFGEGFREYEWRVAGTYGRDYIADPRDEKRTLPRPSTLLPLDCAGKRILLLSDQGIGDDLFFLRYAPVLRGRGAHLAYRPPPKLASLAARGGWADEVILPGAALPQFDHAFAVSDLALLAGAEAAALRALPMRAAPGRVEVVRSRLAAYGARPWIGVTWRAGTGFKMSEYASLLKKDIEPQRLGAALAPLDARIVILQRAPAEAEIAAFERALGRRSLDLSAANDDLEDMCALLTLLDGYAGVSNTNMHLCAALGRTAHILVPWPPEWRWMNQGRESPWFPGFPIFRQAPDGDWQAALGELAQKLALL